MGLDEKVGNTSGQNEEENIFGYLTVQGKKIPIKKLFIGNNADYSEEDLKKEYTRVLNSEDSIWTIGNEINEDHANIVYFSNDGKIDSVNLSLDSLVEVVNKVLNGEVNEIELTSRDREIIRANIQRALDYVGGYSNREEYHNASEGEKKVFNKLKDDIVNDSMGSLEARRGALKAAMYAMALTGYLNDKSFLEKIKRGLEGNTIFGGITVNNVDLAKTVGEVLNQFNQIDEYHSDLPYGEYYTVMSILESKINPRKDLTPEEAFKKGYDETMKLQTKVWLDNAYAAKVYYTDENGKRQHMRLDFQNIDTFVREMIKNNVKDMNISNEDRGKLYASVKRSVEFLLKNNDSDSSSYWKNKLFAEKAAKGFFVLYKLGRFNEKDIEKDVSELYKNGREELGDLLKEELSIYKINLN